MISYRQVQRKNEEEKRKLDEINQQHKVHWEKAGYNNKKKDSKGRGEC